MMNELKDFFKQEFEDFSSQIGYTSFFFGIMLSIAFIAVGFNCLFIDTEYAKEMRKPSSEYSENHNLKTSGIYITQFFKN
jgi:hypothetical protein